MTPAKSQNVLSHILRAARTEPKLRRRAGGVSWTAELALVSGPVMRKVNALYRRKDKVTDILSFPAPEPFRDQGLLGELIICLPVLRRQAREQKHSVERELEVLLVHGVLHLLGFDHEKGARAEAEMQRWEKKLLGRVGLIGRD